MRDKERKGNGHGYGKEAKKGKRRCSKLDAELQGQYREVFCSKCNYWETSTNHQTTREYAAEVSGVTGACTTEPAGDKEGKADWGKYNSLPGDI